MLMRLSCDRSLYVIMVVVAPFLHVHSISWIFLRFLRYWEGSEWRLSLIALIVFGAMSLWTSFFFVWMVFFFILLCCGGGVAALFSICLTAGLGCDARSKKGVSSVARPLSNTQWCCSESVMTFCTSADPVLLEHAHAFQSDLEVGDAIPVDVAF